MASITTLLAGDTGPVSRGVINTNFTNINNELTTASSDIDAAQTDISALETDKLNKNAELRTGNGAWKVVYNNGSGNETELALGAADTFLKSNGETSAPSFGNPSVDINGQTEDTTGNMDADFALVYDTSAGANRKQKVNVFRATDAEVDAGTSTTKFSTPAQTNKYTPNTLLRNDWITHTFPILIGGNVSGTAGWTESNISTTKTDSGLGNYNVLGSTAGAFTLSASLPGISAGALYSPANNKDIRIKWRMAFSSTTDRNGVGMCITPANIHTAQTDITNGEIRFIRNGATLYAQNANGTAATSTNVTGSYTLTNMLTYEIVFNPGVDIKFYIQGTLVTTHTTNLPTTGSLVFAFGADNNGSSRSIYTGPITTSIEI